MSRRKRRGRFFSGREVKEMKYIPAPEKKTQSWAKEWMDYIYWGPEGEQGFMRKLNTPRV